MEQKVHQLEINMAEIKTNLKNFGDKLSEHIIDQKETDKKVDNNFEEVKNKIDKLSDTFQTRIGDKADQKEIMKEFDGLNRKYAPYSVYTVSIWVGSIIAGSLLLGLLALIGRAYLHLY